MQTITEKPYRIVLVDDHALLRKGIKMALDERDEWKVVGETADGLELFHLLSQLSPHLVILDLSLPTLGGIEATQRIKSLYPEIKVLVLTMHKEPDFLREAFRAGAEGYLLKEDAYSELFSAIESIQRGERYVSPFLGNLEWFSSLR